MVQSGPAPSNSLYGHWPLAIFWFLLAALCQCICLLWPSIVSQPILAVCASPHGCCSVGWHWFHFVHIGVSTQVGSSSCCEICCPFVTFCFQCLACSSYDMMHACLHCVVLVYCCSRLLGWVPTWAYFWDQALALALPLPLLVGLQLGIRGVRDGWARSLVVFILCCMPHFLWGRLLDMQSLVLALLG